MLNNDQSLAIFGQRLQAQAEEITREPLPRRWIELLHDLEEREHLGLTDAERAEKHISELLSTAEPTDKGGTLLEDLRRRVARALTARE